jgi:hypothetical protein
MLLLGGVFRRASFGPQLRGVIRAVAAGLIASAMVSGILAAPARAQEEDEASEEAAPAQPVKARPSLSLAGGLRLPGRQAAARRLGAAQIHPFAGNAARLAFAWRGSALPA